MKNREGAFEALRPASQGPGMTLPAVGSVVLWERVQWRVEACDYEGHVHLRPVMECPRNVRALDRFLDKHRDYPCSYSGMAFRSALRAGEVKAVEEART